MGIEQGWLSLLNGAAPADARAMNPAFFSVLFVSSVVKRFSPTGC